MRGRRIYMRMVGSKEREWREIRGREGRYMRVGLEEFGNTQF